MLLEILGLERTVSLQLSYAPVTSLDTEALY